VNTNTLLTIAQLAVGLIGVSAIVSVFLSQGGLHPYDRWRFAMIVFIGMLVVLGSFIPIWIGYFLGESESTWRTASIISIVVNLLFAIPSIRYGSRVFVPSENTTRRAYLWAFPMLAAIAFSLLVTNSLGWPLPPNQFSYEASLFAALIQVAIYFVDLTVFRPPEDGEGAA
jgi:hypothetical protein